MINTITNHSFTRFCAATAIAFSLLVPATFSQASIINADFGSGFDNWQAELVGDFSNVYPAQPSLYADNFSLNGNAVTITNTDEFWSTVLYQDFLLATISAGDSISLSLEVLTDLSDVSDFLILQLRDVVSNDVLDLSLGGVFSLTDWAGRNVSLEMGIQDNDFVTGDSLTVSAINLAVNSVSAPGIVLLMLLSIFAMIRIKN